MPPLDLYLNKRLADFESRMNAKVLDSGQGPGAPKKAASEIVLKACNKIHRRFRKRRRGRGPSQRLGPQGPTAVEQAAATATEWACQEDEEHRKLDTSQIVEREWKARWERQQEGRPVRLADEDPPDLLFTDKALKKHDNLTKAQSSLLTQARTGAIGLRDFLFKVKVPGVATPYCECGEDKETVEHLVVRCPTPPTQRTWEAREIRSHRDLRLVLRGIGDRNARLARKVLSWLMDTGRLLEYCLARRLELETGGG